MKTCECGCGQEVKRRFVTHHNLRIQENCAKRQDVALKKSIGQKAAIARKSPEERELQYARMRTTIRGKFANDSHRAAYSERMRSRWRDPKFVDALQKALPRRRASIQRAWANASPDHRADRIRAASLGAGFHPNKQELRLQAIIQEEFPSEFEINVSDCRVIAGKLPDFIHRSLPIVIEMFGTYWHGPEKTGRDNRTEEELRKAHFAQHGYRVIVIWEDELDDRALVVRKLTTV